MPNGSTLAGIMQPALNTPGLQGAAKSALLTRLVGANLATKAVKAYLDALATCARPLPLWRALRKASCTSKVNLEALRRTIAAVTDDRTLGKVEFTVRGRWDGGRRVESTSGPLRQAGVEPKAAIRPRSVVVSSISSWSVAGCSSKFGYTENNANTIIGFPVMAVAVAGHDNHDYIGVFT